MRRIRRGEKEKTEKKNEPKKRSYFSCLCCCSAISFRIVVCVSVLMFKIHTGRYTTYRLESVGGFFIRLVNHKMFGRFSVNAYPVHYINHINFVEIFEYSAQSMDEQCHQSLWDTQHPQWLKSDRPQNNCVAPNPFQESTNSKANTHFSPF